MYILDNEPGKHGTHVLGDKPFGIICHPKTASQSCKTALLELGARTVQGQHYYDEEECDKILEAGGILVSTVRNPWETMISWYFYSGYNKKYNGEYPYVKPFTEWIYHWLEHGNGWIEKGLFYGAGHCNRIIRFEYDIQKQLNHCLNDCGLPSVELEQRGKTDHKHYSHYYDIPSALAVGRYCEQEVIEWGYNFEYEI